MKKAKIKILSSLLGGKWYHYVRYSRGHYKIIQGDDTHVGDIVKDGKEWHIETVGGQVLSSARLLEGAKKEVRNVINDLVTASGND